MNVLKPGEAVSVSGTFMHFTAGGACVVTIGKFPVEVPLADVSADDAAADEALMKTIEAGPMAADQDGVP